MIKSCQQYFTCYNDAYFTMLMKGGERKSLLELDGDLPEEIENIDIQKMGILQYQCHYYYIIGPRYYVASNPEKDKQLSHKPKSRKEKAIQQSHLEQHIPELKYIVDGSSRKDPLFLKAAAIHQAGIPCKVYYKISHINPRGVRYIQVVKLHQDSFESYWEKTGKSLEHAEQDERFIATTMAYIEEQVKQTIQDASPDEINPGKDPETVTSQKVSRHAPPHSQNIPNRSWDRKKTRRRRKIHHALRRRMQS